MTARQPMTDPMAALRASRDGAAALLPVRFVVPGMPTPQGSKRVVRGRLIDANPAALRSYRSMVAGGAVDALEASAHRLGLLEPSEADNGSQGRTDPSMGPSEAEAAPTPSLYLPDPTREPVAVALRFVLPRPRHHYGTGRNAGRLKGSAPAWPTVKPDVDKLTRAVLDALTGVVWVDDCQVVVLSADKVYARGDGGALATLVTITAAPKGA